MNVSVSVTAKEEEKKYRRRSSAVTEYLTSESMVVRARILKYTQNFEYTDYATVTPLENLRRCVNNLSTKIRARGACSHQRSGESVSSCRTVCSRCRVYYTCSTYHFPMQAQLHVGMIGQIGLNLQLLEKTGTIIVSILVHSANGRF